MTVIFMSSNTHPSLSELEKKYITASIDHKFIGQLARELGHSHNTISRFTKTLQGRIYIYI